MAAIIATAARTATAAHFEAVSERDAHFAAVALKEDGNEAVKAGCDRETGLPLSSVSIIY